MRKILFVLSLLVALPAFSLPRNVVLRTNVSEGAFENRIRALKPALWIDPSDNSSVITSGGAGTTVSTVSSISSKYGSVTFTQSTDSLRPLLTRGDNKENWIGKNTDPSVSPWDYQGGSVTVSGSTITATTITGIHGVANATAERYLGLGEQIKVIFDVKYNNYQYLWLGSRGDSVFHGVVVDVQNGTITGTPVNLDASSIESRTGGGYRVTLTWTKATSSNFAPGAWFSNVSDAVSPPSFTGAGTEKFELYGIWAYRTGSDEYLLNNDTDYPQLRGTNGKRALRYDNQAYLRAPAGSFNPTTANFEIYAVVRYEGNSDGSTNYKILGNETYQVMGFEVRGEGSGLLNPTTFRTSQSAASTSVYNGTHGESRTDIVVAAIANGVNSETRQNTIITQTGSINAPVSSTNPLNLGLALQGNLYYLLAFDRSLPESDRQFIIRGLMKRFGIN